MKITKPMINLLLSLLILKEGKFEDLPGNDESLNNNRHYKKINSSLNSIESLNQGKCKRDIKYFFDALKNQEQWTFRVIDAFDKKAIFNVRWIGSRESCTVLSRTNETKSLFKRHYCSLDLRSNSRSVSNYGFCFPESCSEEYLQSVISSISDHFKFQCYPINKWKLIWKSSAIFCLILILLTIFGTAYDIKIKRKTVRNVSLIMKYSDSIVYEDKQNFKCETKNEEINNTWVDVVLCFSCYTNGKKLVKLQYYDETFSCLHGLRVISTLAIIYSHVFLFAFSIDNVLGLLYKLSTMSSFWFLNSHLALNAFFAMSGFLLAYGVLKFNEEGKKISWLHLYFDRFLRITPMNWLYPLVIHLGIVQPFLMGPNDSGTYKNLEACRRLWWTNILYIQNYFGISKGCFSGTWYLSTDFQLFLFSPIFLSLMIRNKVKVLITLCLVIYIGTSIYVAKLSYDNHFKLLVFSPISSTENTMDYFDSFYIQPYYRITPYVIGMISAWIFFKTHGKVLLKKIYIRVLWCSVLVLCVPLMLIFPYDSSLNTNQSIAYSLAHVLLWTGGFVILIYLCITGHGGIINSFLSWKGWAPFSRLSFAMYFSHFASVSYLTRPKWSATHFTFLGHFQYWLGCTLLTAFTAVLLHLLIEAPFNRLREIFFLKRRSDRKITKNW